MARWRLGFDVALRVGYEDHSHFGSPMTARAHEAVRALYRPVLDHVRQHGFGDLLRVGPDLLDGVVASAEFAAIASADGGASVGGQAWSVRPEVLYPDAAQSRPRTLAFVRSTGKHLRVSLPDEAWPVVHDLVARLGADGCRDTEPDLHPHARQLLEDLRDNGLLDQAGDETDEDWGGPGLTFLGHNTVVVRSPVAAVVVDPFLFAEDPSYPASYQPLALSHLGSVDAVLVTHSHPDHFDPASLLRFPLDVRVIVPPVERETILTADIPRRLRELGFTAVEPLPWGSSTVVGDIRVHALPFYGEQPTDGDVLHPTVRNEGNTYVVATPDVSAAFLADSGRDLLGDVRDVAAGWCRDHGPVDVVFSGYRGWDTFPVQLLFSSVAAFLLFVPRQAWGVRQRLMNDAVDAVDVAERWGARYLVPYADGGAPWHWAIGLGPRLDGTGVEDVAFDPYPDRVVDAARARVEVPGGDTLASPVDVLLLRPGDSVAGLPPDGAVEVLRRPGYGWPYGDDGRARPG